MNLLKETVDDLRVEGKSPSDVLWALVKGYKTTWEDFENRADFDYNNGFGVQEIDSGICIVGKDWWLERAEYDGSEWWVFKQYPEEPKESKLIKTLKKR